MKIVYKCLNCGHQWADEEVRALDPHAVHAVRSCHRCPGRTVAWTLRHDANPVIARPETKEAGQ